jgi:hypothetical protein
MIKNLFNKLFKLFATFDEKTYAYQYLSESHDHVDLERRMKELDERGIRWK